ncbi:MAG: HlyD family efflux transporter periplasmic adaptor subunit [Magnetococcales bacterium]|nr:HlyD family efflux transporter periplasmic adaptor subunit [Magnetococcales bacterium]
MRHSTATPPPLESEQQTELLHSRQLTGLTTLLSLEKEARHAADREALGFIMVNESLRLLPYNQAVFWSVAADAAIRLVSFSGVARFDPHASQVVWLQSFISRHHQESAGQPCHTLALAQLEAADRADWQQWSHPHVLWLPFHHPHRNEVVGGLWLARDHPWERGEQRLAEHLADGYAHALVLLSRSARFSLHAWLWPRWLRGVVWLLLLLVLAGWPVRQSVLAPATVVARQPTLMAAPVDGVVYRFHVVPNQVVAVGQALFELDPTEFDNRLQLATEELAIAQAQYQKAANKAFQSVESGGEMATLRAAMLRAATQAEQARQLLQRLQVTAPVAGVVMFSDVNQWLGRPVRVGERILSIADPADIEVEILLPVADALVLEPGAETRLFLNTEPLQPLPGRLRYASYEASSTPEGVLAYRLRSTFLAETAFLAHKADGPRLGLKGTAKLFGEQVPLVLYLLRRPLAALRQKTGW